MRSWFLFCAGSLLLVRPVQAAPQGVWKGTLGKNAIVACFNAPDHGGSYYYLRHRVPIALAYRATDGRWLEQVEDPASPKPDSWLLEPAHDGMLQGQWMSADGLRSSHVALQLVGDAGDPRACASADYVKSLDAAIAVIQGKRIVFGTHAYRTLDLGNSQALQILDGGSAADAVNRALARDLDRSPAAVAAFVDARHQALGDDGATGKDELDTYPVYWTSRWLMIRHYRWASGMGRNGISWSYSTWDMSSGKQVDPWTWFAETAAAARRRKASGGTPLTPRLHALFFEDAAKAAASGDSGESADGDDSGSCASYDAADASYDLTLADDGFHFDQPAYGDGCDHAFALPFEQAMPLLTTAGRQVVEGILAGDRSGSTP